MNIYEYLWNPQHQQLPKFAFSAFLRWHGKADPGVKELTGPFLAKMDGRHNKNKQIQRFCGWPDFCHTVDT